MRVNNTPLFFKGHYFIYKAQSHTRRAIFTRQTTIISHPAAFGKPRERIHFRERYDPCGKKNSTPSFRMRGYRSRLA